MTARKRIRPDAPIQVRLMLCPKDDRALIERLHRVMTAISSRSYSGAVRYVTTQGIGAVLRRMEGRDHE